MKQGKPMKRTGFKRKPAKKKATGIDAMTLNELGKAAWRLMSKYVRLRDKQICFTCGQWVDPEARDTKGRKSNKYHAGHYKHAGKKNPVTYDERNINGQCFSCNHYKSGDPVTYAIKLEEKYGFGVLQELETLKKQDTGQCAQERKEWMRAKIREIEGKLEEMESL